MYKRNLIILLFILFACLYASIPVAADVITMKNGKKYTGVIIEFYEGKYMLKVKEKVYPIQESQVADVQYTSDTSQVQSALTGEKLHENKAVEKHSWLYATAGAGYLIPLFSKYTEMIDGGMMFFGASFGVQSESYGLGAEVLYGSMAGSFSYYEPGAVVMSTSSISTGSLAVMLDVFYKGKLEGLPVTLFTNFGIGPLFNFDSLDNYPLGWKEYEYYSGWMLDPDTIDAGAVNAVYLGGAIKGGAGADFTINDMIAINLKAGYMLLTRNGYKNPFKYNPEISFVGFEDPLIAGGIYASLAAKIIF